MKKECKTIIRAEHLLFGQKNYYLVNEVVPLGKNNEQKQQRPPFLEAFVVKKSFRT
jgi:hypothetical protein